MEDVSEDEEFIIDDADIMEELNDGSDAGNTLSDAEMLDDDAAGSDDELDEGIVEQQLESSITNKLANSHEITENNSVAAFSLHQAPVYSVHLLGKLCVSGGGDDMGYIWDIATGSKISDLALHLDSVIAVAFSTDGQFVATGGLDGIVNVFNVQSGQLSCALSSSSEIMWIDWHPRGNVLLAGTEDGTCWMWTIPTGQCMHVLAGHSDSVTCGRFSPDGKSVVTGSSDCTIYVWDPKSGLASQRFTSADERFHQSSITSLDISPDSALIISGGLDGSLNVLQLSTGKILGTLKPHRESIESIKFANCLGLFATASVDASIIIWDLNTMKKRTTLHHDDAVTKLQWTKNNTNIISASTDCTLRIWSGRTGECLSVLRGHTGAIYDFCFDEEAKLLVGASEDGHCLVFNAPMI